jgi:multiple sugar transport system permease protein
MTSASKSSKAFYAIVRALPFLAPWLLHFLALDLYPFVASFYYSLTRYSVLNPPRFIGLDNYVELLTQDPLFGVALYNTLYYAFFALGLGTTLAIALALALNTKIRGLSFYRTIYYLPSVTPAVAAAVLWIWVLDPQFGILNTFLYWLGLPSPGWLADPAWAKPALILMSLWSIGGTVVIYLAGLQDIPAELIEAAALDGATAGQRLWHITLPLLTPVIFFNVVTGLIGALQYFTQAYVMTRGGPADATLFYALYLYESAFTYLKMGYASALAWILFLLIMGLTILIVSSSRRWVYYTEE